jgi:hypothetical protein
MRSKLAILLLAFSLPAIAHVPKGRFIGASEIKGYKKSESRKHKWYHLTEVTFNGDSVFVEQSPIAIYRKDTLFSASDGGFYHWAGVLHNIKNGFLAEMTLVQCDYCPDNHLKFTPPKIIEDGDTTSQAENDTSTLKKELPITIPRKKIFAIALTKNKNEIRVNGRIYRREINE